MNLKSLRMGRSLTQAVVAETIGCSTVVYSRYETGEREPSISVLCKLADFYGVTVDYLIGRQDVSTSGASSYEHALVSAARNADERARQDALLILDSHRSNS